MSYFRTLWGLSINFLMWVKRRGSDSSNNNTSLHSYCIFLTVAFQSISLTDFLFKDLSKLLENAERAVSWEASGKVAGCSDISSPGLPVFVLSCSVLVLGLWSISLASHVLTLHLSCPFPIHPLPELDLLV